MTGGGDLSDAERTAVVSGGRAVAGTPTSRRVGGRPRAGRSIGWAHEAEFEMPGPRRRRSRIFGFPDRR